MCGNRVEELESQVKELQASVEGLTDELVECKVRLRELEDAVDDELGFVPKTPREESDADGSDSQDQQPPGPDESHDAAKAPNTGAPDGDDNTEDPESDIIVA